MELFCNILDDLDGNPLAATAIMVEICIQAYFNKSQAKHAKFQLPSMSSFRFVLRSNHFNKCTLKVRT